MKPNKPWLRSDGQLKSEKEIKASCKNWNPSIWEDYLKTLEIELKEELFEKPLSVEEHSSEDHEKFYHDVLSANEFPVLERCLLGAAQELTGKQKSVLREHFWEGLSLRQIARSSRVSPNAIALTKERALKQLSGILISKLLASASEVQRLNQQKLLETKSKEVSA